MPPTILIIDDALEELKPFIRFLETSGFQIAVAPNGESALNQIRHVRPDLILLDVSMPGLNGIETCRRLKAIESVRDVPVIFLTCLADMVDKLKGFEAGGADYITKPFHHEEVLARIKTHLELQRLHRELRQEHDRLHSLADAALEGIVVYAGEQILEINHASEKLFGYPRADLLNKAVSELLTPAFRPLLTGPLPADPQSPQEAEGLTHNNAAIPIELQIRAIDWLGQPARVAAIRDLSWRKILEQRQTELQQDRYKCGALIGKSAVMQAVYAQIEKAAASEANVVILGESGTGKELVARTIHQLSNRKTCEFVPVNCGAVPENLFEREFFGHRKGAFTGADRDKPGYFDQAHQGMLFLDEVGELSPAMQVKLLRVIESGEYIPVGDNKPQKADVRIIAATNKDLNVLRQQGQVREDFFYRIHIFVIHLPPLRERCEDLPLLIEHFLQQRGGQTSCAFIPANIMDALCRYDWPGNVRELQNELQRYLDGQPLEFVGKDLLREIDRPPLEKSLSITLEDLSLQDARDAFEQAFICAALQKNAWRRGDTAEKLGISPKALYNKIHKYGLDHGK